MSYFVAYMNCISNKVTGTVPTLATPRSPYILAACCLDQEGHRTLLGKISAPMIYRNMAAPSGKVFVLNVI